MKSVEKAAVAKDAGHRVRTLRDMRGLTRDAMSSVIDGLDGKALANYEDGLRMLPPELALKIATHFGVTLDWIYGGKIEGLPYQTVRDLKQHSEGAPN